MSFDAMFLGVGSAQAASLGNASLVITKEQRPWLMIDCGFDSLLRYAENFDEQLPNAIFITHCHYDHIGGLEQLYFQSRFSQHKPCLYVPHTLISTLVNLLNNTGIAEGGENVWDVLRLIPVANTFYHDGVQFSVYSARHHHPQSAFSLHMPGYFFYSGDTRPVPEVVHHHVNQNEVIFHDCCVQGNPSHSGIEDLLREYSKEALARFVVYHYNNNADTIEFAKRNLAYATQNVIYTLPHCQHSAAYIQLFESA